MDNYKKQRTELINILWDNNFKIEGIINLAKKGNAIACLHLARYYSDIERGTYPLKFAPHYSRTESCKWFNLALNTYNYPLNLVHG